MNATLGERIEREIALFRSAAKWIDHESYDIRRPGPREAWFKDARWFAADPSRQVRIRRLTPAESGIAAWAAGPQGRAEGAVVYAIVIHHLRRDDARREVGVSLTILLTEEGEGLHEFLRGEARKLLNWFQHFSTQPEEDEGVWPRWGVAARNTPEGERP